MTTPRKRVWWLHEQIVVPPFTKAGAMEAGTLLRLLQEGESLEFPAARPMPGIGPGCGELRVRDEEHNWRIIDRADPDAVVVVEIFQKKTRQTPKAVIDLCKKRFREYDEAKAAAEKEAARKQ